MITLFKQNGSWMARNTNPQVLALFGTDTLPTPFTSAMPAWHVQKEIARLNPESVVELAV